jgi:hypothetical protein
LVPQQVLVQELLLLLMLLNEQAFFHLIHLLV